MHKNGYYQRFTLIVTTFLTNCKRKFSLKKIKKTVENELLFNQKNNHWFNQIVQVGFGS
jgi:hypothetical protein